MDKLIKEAKFVKMYFDEELSLFTWEWLPSTEDMFDADAKATLTEIMVALKKHKPKYAFGNGINNLGIFSVGIQEWIGEMMAKTFIECEIKRIAIFLPGEFISQVATGQAKDSVNSNSQGKFKMKPFLAKDMELAKKWLFEG